MPPSPRLDPPAPPATPDDESARRDAAGLEEYLVEYLCRERITADEIKELLLAEAFSSRHD